MLQFLFETLVILVSYTTGKKGVATSPKNLGEKLINFRKCFITYNLKIKNNMLYLILLIEVGIFPIKSMSMTRHLIYKHKINNMGDQGLPKIALNSSQNQSRLKQVWIKDVVE